MLYVGKAGNLNSRIRSYFGSPAGLPPKVQRLVTRIHDFEFMITGTEQEALILESNMIKKYSPRFNVHLKDNKSLPYLRISVNEDWPRVCITRRVAKDGARYFGPFASTSSVRRTLRLIKRIFPFRSCSKHLNGGSQRPCLNYHIHRCLGPCAGTVDREEYDALIKQVILFLHGREEVILADLQVRMKKAARQFRFEKAALLRDQIRAIEEVIEGGRISVALQGDQDIVALAQDEQLAYIQVFFVRNSKLIGRDHFTMEGVSDESPAEIMTGFVKQYYASASYIPPLILLQHPVNEAAVLSQWLRQERRGSVRLHVPRRGARKRLVETAAENAESGLRHARARQTRAETISAGLQELKERLHLPALPLRIECYDVSNIQGTQAVGSMAVLENGIPRPASYRRFRIRTVSGADDYAMIREVLRRRFQKGLTGTGTWSIVPDLVLIDGGRGQLNAAVAVREELGLGSLPIASLAKEEEKVFVPAEPAPLSMAQDSPGLHLLQRARDEAHRFAISYHQKLRRRETIKSALDSVAGIGPGRKKALLTKFGSVEAIRRASLEALSETKGITPAIARRVKEYLEDAPEPGPS